MSACVYIVITWAAFDSYSKVFLLLWVTHPLKLSDLKTVREILSESIHINICLQKYVIF